jgi:hypothetical protein
LSDSTALWAVIYASFEGHRFRPDGPPDPDAQAALDRIAAKCIGVHGRSFNPSNCAVREQVLSVDELRRLRRHHDRPFPKRTYEPIVLLSFASELFIVDGHNRVNKWLAESRVTPRKAIIIEPSDPS